MADRVRNVRNERVPTILDAAELEFSQKGYDGTSIQAIADRAGLTKRQIIHYFKTKDKLYWEIIDRIFRDWKFFDLLTKDGDPKQIFSDYIEQRLLLSKNKPQRNNLLLLELIRGAPVILRILKEDDAEKIITQFRKRYDHWMDGNKNPNIDPLQYIFVLWACFSFHAAFAPEVAFLMGRKKMADSDWAHIITQVKRILLAIFDSPES